MSVFEECLAGSPCVAEQHGHSANAMQAVWDRAVQRLAGYRQKEVYVHPAAGDAGLAAGAALYVYYQVLWHPTDLLRKLVDRGAPVRCSLIKAGWLEIDTLEDYEATRTFEFD